MKRFLIIFIILMQLQCDGYNRIIGSNEMGTLNIINGKSFVLNSSYEITSDNKHYAGSGGGGHVTSSFLGTFVNINLSNIMGLDEGFIRLPHTTKNSDTLLPLMEIHRVSDNYEYDSNEIIPINTDIKVHTDWLDRIKKPAVRFEYSKDKNIWTKFMLEINVPNEISSYTH